MERAVTAQENGGKNTAAGWSTLIFIFLYAPCYNIGPSILYADIYAPH